MDKKQIFISFIVFLLSIAIFILGNIPTSNTAKILGFNNDVILPKQLYRVYLEGKSIGIIESKSELENYIDQKQEEIKNKYKVKKVYAPNDLDIVEETTYNEKISTIDDIYQIIEKIKGKASFTIDGYEIEIEGLEKASKEDDETTIKVPDQTIYVLKKSIFENSVKKTITAFIDDDLYESYLNDTQKPLIENEPGSIVESLHIENKITIKKAKIPVDEKIYQTEEELSKYLLFGTLDEQETYTVKEGDTISDIAYNNKLSTDEFLIANTNFKTENDLLYPGQVVNLGLINPQFDLVEVDHTISKQTIQKETVYKDDPDQYIGYEQVEEEGSDGLALIGQLITVVNGEIQDLRNISNIEITPAVNRVIIRGTRRSTTSIDPEVPIGLGSWVWPTNTPYTISSTFSWRWGKHHDAVDISGTGYGSAIKAANNGIVVVSDYTSYNGNYIIIKHSNNYYTIYAHLASRTKQVGALVMAGDKIGTMGQTGFAQGVHLHFGTYKGYPFRGGVAFDPLSLY